MRIETTLLVHPQVLADFADYNDFLGLAEAAVDELGLEGVIQVASFHPRYQFAGTAPDDLGNATNRSPYPTLHLLREESVERAVDAFPEAEAIFEANIATMRRLGESGWANCSSSAATMRPVRRSRSARAELRRRSRAGSGARSPACSGSPPNRRSA